MKYLGFADQDVEDAEIQLPKTNLIGNKKKKQLFGMRYGSLKIHQQTIGTLHFLNVQTALILPHSNANIEALFSRMNYVKLKLESKMKLPKLNYFNHKILIKLCRKIFLDIHCLTQ